MTTEIPDLNTPPKIPRFNLRSLIQSTVLPVALTLILFVCTTFFLAVPTMKDKLAESRKEMIRELTNAVWALLNSYEQKVHNGEMTLQDAQQRALSHIRAIQFGPDNKDYFWINDHHPRMVMHPYRVDLEGQDLTEFKDENGVYLFKEFVKTVENSGEGYVEYLWQWQDNKDQIQEKLSFVKGFKPWNWIIGTGIYPQDVNRQIESVTVQFRTLLLVTLLIVVILSTFVILQARKREKDHLISLMLWRDSEIRYRTLVESMSEGMAIENEDRTLAYVNNAFCKILGYSREELVGQDFYSFLDDENREILSAQNRKRKEGESSIYEITAIGKDSNRVNVLVSGKPYYDQKNKYSGTFALLIDITEQKKKDRALMENEEKFRAVFEISPNLITLIRNKDFCCIDVNKAFCELCGLDKNKIIGQSVFDLNIFYKNADLSHLIDKLASTRNQLVSEEIKLIGNNGKILTILLSTKSIYVNDESHTVCFGRNITERIEAEEKYHSIVHTMKDGYGEMDLRGRFLFSNEALSDILDYTREEILLAKYENRLSKENTKRMRKLFLKIYKTGESIEAIELDYIKKDGNVGYLEFSVIPVLDAKGLPRAFSCIFRDVTARRKSEQEMENMRLYLKNTIDLMPSILIVMDEDLKITQWNLEAEKVTGIPFHKAKGSDFSKTMGAFSQHEELIRRVISRNKPHKFEKFTTAINGENKTYDIMIYPIQTPALEGVVLRIDDITNRIRMEEIMIQSEKMMSIGELAAGTAHEINNPLGGILHAAQIIERRITTDRRKNLDVAEEFGLDLERLNQFLEKQKVLYYIDGIRKSGIRAADIVSRMLQFSRASQSQMTIVTLPDLLERSLALAGSDFDLRKKYDFKSLNIVKNYDQDLPSLPCVAMEIEQVLLNIFKNAAQAMSEKTNKDGIRPTLTVGMRKSGDNAVITISDNGPGMDEQTRKKVFQPFFTTKPVGEGTGLGLSVSYMIITNNHNGTIEVTSTPDKESTFIITLPLRQPSSVI